MRHLTRGDAQVVRLLKRARTVAVIGASPRSDRHSHVVVSYLKDAGYDVIPIRPDRKTVAGLPTYASLDDVPGAVDIVVIFRRPEAVPEHIEEAARRKTEAVWLQPGTASNPAIRRAEELDLVLIRDRCIEEDHSDLMGTFGSAGAGHPEKLGVHVSRRRRTFEDNRRRPEESGWTEAGGGGSAAGGGGRAVLDEKKMIRGRPSPRQGPLRKRKA